MSEPEVYRQGRRLARGFSLPWSHPSSSLGLSFSKVLYLPESRVLRVSSTLVYICRRWRGGASLRKWGQPLHLKANLQPDRPRVATSCQRRREDTSRDFSLGLPPWPRVAALGG